MKNKMFQELVKIRVMKVEIMSEARETRQRCKRFNRIAMWNAEIFAINA